MNAQKHALDEAIIKEKQVTFKESKLLNQHLVEIKACNLEGIKF